MLVGEDEDGDVAKLIGSEETHKLLLDAVAAQLSAVTFRSRAREALWISGIHDEDESIGAVVVVLPALADLLLASNIPACEGGLGARDLDLLRVEPYGGNAMNGLTTLHLIKKSGLSSSIEPEEEDPVFFVAKQG